MIVISVQQIFPVMPFSVLPPPEPWGVQSDPMVPDSPVLPPVEPPPVELPGVGVGAGLVGVVGAEGVDPLDPLPLGNQLLQPEPLPDDGNDGKPEPLLPDDGSEGKPEPLPPDDGRDGKLNPLPPDGSDGKLEPVPVDGNDGKPVPEPQDGIRKAGRALLAPARAMTVAVEYFMLEMNV